MDIQCVENACQHDGTARNCDDCNGFVGYYCDAHIAQFMRLLCPQCAQRATEERLALRKTKRAVAPCDNCRKRPAECEFECVDCAATLCLCAMCADDFDGACPYCTDTDDESATEDDDEDVAVGPSVGIIQTGKKPPLDEFLHMLTHLEHGVRSLTSEEGLDAELLQERVDQVAAVYEEVTSTLGRSAPVRGGAAYKGEHDPGPTGLYGIIRDYDHVLMQAAFVLNAYRAYLARRNRAPSDEAYPPAPVEAAKCPFDCTWKEAAKSGRTIVRVYKKYLAYKAIWAGKKWISGKLAATLGVPKVTKSATPAINPIKALSDKNVKRLQEALLQNAIQQLGRDPCAERKATLLKTCLRVRAELEAVAAEYHKAARALAAKHFDDSRIVIDGEPVRPDFDECRKLARDVQILEKRVGLLRAQAAWVENSSSHAASLRQMGLLSEEVALFGAVLDLPFTIKHATPNWYCISNDGSLDSFMEFQKKNPDWKSEFSTPGNVSKLGNHGFVFFRVDVGYDAITTRYGGTTIMDDLEVIEKDGWVSLFDQLKPLSSKTIERTYDQDGNLIRHAMVKHTNHFIQRYEYGLIPPQTSRNGSSGKQALSFTKSNTERAGAHRYLDLDRECSFTDFVFFGPQIRVGIALSLVYELRFFQRCGYREHLLATFASLRNPDERVVFLQQLIGQFFRPEGKYPVSLRFTERPVTGMHVLTPEGDARWNPDATENPEVMNDVKIIQRRKLLEEATAQAKKTYFTHVSAAERNRARSAEAAASASATGSSNRKKRKVDPLMEAEEQDRKAAIRKAEWDRNKADLAKVELAYAGIRERNPHLIVDEEATKGTSFSRGLGAASFKERVATNRKRCPFLVSTVGRIDEGGESTIVSYGVGSSFRMVRVDDDGNCFFRCCALFLGGNNTHVALRGRLSQSPHLKDAERLRVGTDRNYATMEDMTAMARELDLTLVVHRASYATMRPIPSAIHMGRSGAIMHVLFLYNPADGLGHITLLMPNTAH